MLPYGAALLLTGASSSGGGGGGSMTAGPTIRGSKLIALTTTNPVNFTFPTGTAQGDLLVGFGVEMQHMVSVGSGQGTWTVDDSPGGFGWTGLAFHKRLDASDITRGYVTLGYNNADDAVLGCVVFADASVGGSELLSGVPTTYSGVTWSGSGTSGTATCAGAGEIVRWAGMLTVGQTYRCLIPYNKTGGAQLRISNGATNGTEVAYTSPSIANGTDTLSFSFTALDTYFAIEADGATFSGTLGSGISVKPEVVHPTFRDIASTLDDVATFSSSSKTVITSSGPQAGDYVIMFGSTHANLTVAVTGAPGSAIQTLSDAKGSAVVRLGTLTSSGSFPETFTFSGGTASGEYCAIIAIQP